ncbi:MAG: DUF4186 domain-containing protein [Actinomycetota bacterium]
MRNLDELFPQLQQSSFRRRFRLQGRELEYLRREGLPKVMEHAAQFINQRLAPAYPLNDGKQTPFGNHPAFVAQHATATCCRGCLEKWHRIPRGEELTAEQKAHVLAALERWLRSQSPEGTTDADLGHE